MISSIDPPWDREIPSKFWCPGRKLLKTIRDYQKLRQKNGLIAQLMMKLCVVRHMFWSSVSGADLPINSQLGGDLLIPHPNGIVIHPGAEIGVNCLIHQQVTIGVKRGDRLPPKIGGHVDIGAGAKILGNIVIGDHALIGANTVVAKDVEPYAIVAGVPGKVIGYTDGRNRQSA